MAYQLIKRGKKVFIVDDSPSLFFSRTAQKIVSSPKGAALIKYADIIYPPIKSLLGPNYKPKVIGGLITPVTGKRFVKTWLADTLLPYAHTFYRNLERDLRGSFYKPQPMIRLFANPQQANDCAVKQADTSYKKYFNRTYIFKNDNIKSGNGYAVLDQGAVIDGVEMLNAFYNYFKTRDLLFNCSLSADDISISEKEITWADRKFRSVIFCDGWRAVENPFFKYLPFMPAKGELLIIHSEKLKLNEIVNKGIFIRPLGNQLFLVGSTYSWHDQTLSTTSQASDELEGKLKSLLQCDYSVLDQLAGIRPTVKGRRPFIGRHPINKNVLIFNGLGTKGLLLAPYFSGHFCDHLIHNYPLSAEVDIKRFPFTRISD